MDRCRKTITRYARIPTLAAILVVGLLGPTSVKAQSSDFGIWSAVGVEKKLTRNGMSVRRPNFAPVTIRRHPKDGVSEWMAAIS